MTISGHLQQHLRRPRTGLVLLLDIACLFAFLTALSYLIFKVIQVSHLPGYDFKYLWLAGETWLRGLSAYSEHYYEIGQQSSLQHFIPYRFSYPPNWFLLVSVFGLFEPAEAFFYWNCLNIFSLLVSSLLLALVFQPYLASSHLPRYLASVFGSPINVFFLHFFFIAVFQVTAITLSNGQTSILMYLGVSLLLYGVNRNSLVAVIGLSILWLKPQLGIVFTLGLLLQGRDHWRLIAYAALVSMVLCIPAMIISPMAPLEWLVNIGQYDDQPTAYAPEMTGVRHLVWLISDADTGSLGTLLLTLLTFPALVWLCCGFARSSNGLAPLDYSQKVILLACAWLAAIGPLHFYDFLLVAVFILLLLSRHISILILGAVGTVMVLRAEDVAVLCGLFSPQTLYYKGSGIGTVAAIMLLLAVVMTLRHPSSNNNS